MKKHVVFGLPAYTGQIHIGTMRTVMAACFELQKRGDRTTIIDDCFGADICGSRNVVAARFLKTDATHLMFIDNDVSAVKGAVTRLIDFNVDLVAAVYPKRQDPIVFPMRFLPGTDGPQGHPSGLLEVAGVAGGFLCIRRNVIQKLWDACPEHEYITDLPPDRKARAIFDHYWFKDEKGTHRLSEDYAFCERWRKLGGKVLIDPEILMAHTGLKEFHGKLLDYMKAA